MNEKPGFSTLPCLAHFHLCFPSLFASGEWRERAPRDQCPSYPPFVPFEPRSGLNQPYLEVFRRARTKRPAHCRPGYPIETSSFPAVVHILTSPAQPAPHYPAHALPLLSYCVYYGAGQKSKARMFITKVLIINVTKDCYSSTIHIRAWLFATIGVCECRVRMRVGISSHTRHFRNYSPLADCLLRLSLHDGTKDRRGRTHPAEAWSLPQPYFQKPRKPPLDQPTTRCILDAALNS